MASPQETASLCCPSVLPSAPLLLTGVNYSCHYHRGYVLGPRWLQMAQGEAQALFWGTYIIRIPPGPELGPWYKDRARGREDTGKCGPGAPCSNAHLIGI